MKKKGLKCTLAFTLSAAMLASVPAMAAPNGEFYDNRNFILADEDGNVTFVAGTDSDVKITNKDEAKAILEEAKTELGGSPESELVFESMLDAGSIDIYNFVQEIHGQVVSGAVAKVIVDDEGKLFAFVSSLSNASPRIFDDPISQEDAENIVLDVLGEDSELEILPGETSEMLLPIDVVLLAQNSEEDQTEEDDTESEDAADGEEDPSEEEAGADDADTAEVDTDTNDADSDEADADAANDADTATDADTDTAETDTVTADADTDTAEVDADDADTDTADDDTDTAEVDADAANDADSDEADADAANDADTATDDDTDTAETDTVTAEVDADDDDTDTTDADSAEADADDDDDELPPQTAEDLVAVWAVYTNNDSTELDSRPYLVHYVSKDGYYLYALPVFQPQSWEANNAVDHSAVYGGKTEIEYTATVTDYDGTPREITIPAMQDDEGTIYLCSLENKMVMGDYYDFNYAPGDATATDADITIMSNKDEDFPNEALLTYDYFKKIRDFYMEQGWNGADGIGTDCLLLYNYCTPDHTPAENCVYLGARTSGWQAFAFSDGFNFGYCPDVMAHEFTHCVTHSAMLYSPYMNDTGAINESMSDVIGKIVEQLAIGETEGPWVMGNDIIPVRYMADPHLGKQPEFTWDQYYIPNTLTPIDQNDNGGVHINSSLMNYVGWKLHEAGMPLMDELNYWLAVDCCLSAKTDYPQLAVLLPWVLETIGYGDYMPTLTEAIEKTRMADKELPDTLAEGCGLISIPIPEDEQFWSEDFNIVIFEADSDYGQAYYPTPDYSSVLTVLPEGEYIAQITYVNEDAEIKTLAYTEDGWIGTDTTELSPEDVTFAVTENEVTELSDTNLEDITLAPHDVFAEVMLEAQAEEEAAEDADADSEAAAETEDAA